jgi:hypothetical protein
MIPPKFFPFPSEKAVHSSVSRLFIFMSLPPMGELILMLNEFEELVRQDCIGLCLNYPGSAVLPFAGAGVKVLPRVVSFFEVQARG